MHFRKLHRCRDYRNFYYVLKSVVIFPLHNGAKKICGNNCRSEKYENCETLWDAEDQIAAGKKNTLKYVVTVG
jgi:hypothetical protein